jgi:hypothetical protein
LRERERRRQGQAAASALAAACAGREKPPLQRTRPCRDADRRRRRPRGIQPAKKARAQASGETARPHVGLATAT